MAKAASLRVGLRRRDELKLLTVCYLMRQKEGFRIPALAAELERAKIFVPRSRGNIWFGLQPDPESVEVIKATVAIAHAFD